MQDLTPTLSLAAESSQMALLLRRLDICIIMTSMMRKAVTRK